MLDGHVSFAEDAVGDDLSIGTFAFLGEPLEGVGGMLDFRLRFRQGFPLFQSHRASYVVESLAHQLGCLLENFSPIPGRELHPTRHGFVGRL